MRRLLVSLAALSMLLALTAGPVAAGRPDTGCPAAASGFKAFPVDLDWELGDPLPAPGADPWWDMTLAGFAAEGLTPEQAAALVGVSSVEELYALVLAGLRGLDRNGDGEICGKPFPAHQQGMAAFFFNAIDNNARAR